MQPLPVWYLLRTLERNACGRLDNREVLPVLQRLGWSQASAYRLISSGMGAFRRGKTTYPQVTRGQRGTSPRDTLLLVGAKALAASWGVGAAAPPPGRSALGDVHRRGGRLELPGVPCLASRATVAPNIEVRDLTQALGEPLLLSCKDSGGQGHL